MATYGRVVAGKVPRFPPSGCDEQSVSVRGEEQPNMVMASGYGAAGCYGGLLVLVLVHGGSSGDDSLGVPFRLLL